MSDLLHDAIATLFVDAMYRGWRTEDLVDMLEVGKTFERTEAAVAMNRALRVEIERRKEVRDGRDGDEATEPA